MPSDVRVPDAPAPAVPVVCDTQVFTRDQRAAQLALALEVLCRLPRHREELPAGYGFEYEGNEELFATVARFAASEHRCCPWIGFTIEMAPFPPGQSGSIRLRLTARESEGKDFLRSSLRFLEENLASLGSGVDHDRAAETMVQTLGPKITRDAVERGTASGKSWKDLFKGCGC